MVIQLFRDGFGMDRIEHDSDVETPTTEKTSLIDG